MAGDLVLLHGWGMSRRVWDPVIPGLEAHFRVHNLALPGYAGADSDAGRYAAMDGGAILDRWSDECLARAPRGARWIGWSLGALVALNAMLRDPDRIGAAVLVAATPKFLRGDGWEAGVARDVMRGFLEGMRAEDDRTLKRFALLQAGDRRTASALSGCLAGGDVDPRTLEAGLRVLEEVDLRARLDGIRAPLRVVHGVRDRVVPREAGAYVAGHVARGELVELEAGHAPFVERPDAFIEAIDAWH